MRPNATNPIHSTGCREEVEALFTNNLEVILGVGIGLLIFQLFNIMLAGGMQHLDSHTIDDDHITPSPSTCASPQIHVVCGWANRPHLHE